MKMMLGPGRFFASAFVDAATLVGLVSERSEEDIETAARDKVEATRSEREAEIKARVAAKREGSHAIELDSAKYFQDSSTPQA